MPRLDHAASMGPLLVCSGMWEQKRPDEEFQDASMGPLLVCSGMRAARPCCPRVAGFNGAAARVQRNVDANEPNGSWGRRASMGPLLVCSGMPTYASTTAPSDWLQWGRCSCAAEWENHECEEGSKLSFNGAAARVQRNAQPGTDRRQNRQGLQWGRCSCAAECIRHARRHSPQHLASMGPLLVCSGMEVQSIDESIVE